MSKINLFLDSGAYSARSKGVTIDIQKYISFIKKNKDSIRVYANLDVINDPEATMVNQKIMEDAGLTPLPCYHYGEDIKYLEYYLSNYSYIAIGGVAGGLKTTAKIIGWLDPLFLHYICDEQGLPKVKVHGFGMTSFSLMSRYPWYSVDSTSWIQFSAYGVVLVPAFRQGVYDYQSPPWRIFVSFDSPFMKDSGSHFETFSNDQQEVIRHYVKEKNIEWGDLEATVPGISNNYKERTKLNIIYYKDIAKFLPKWPWPLKLIEFKRKEGFGL